MAILFYQQIDGIEYECETKCRSYLEAYNNTFPHIKRMLNEEPTLDDFVHSLNSAIATYYFYRDGELKAYVYFTGYDIHTALIHFHLFVMDKNVCELARNFFKILGERNYLAIFQKKNKLIDKLTTKMGFIDVADLPNYYKEEDYKMKRLKITKEV